MRGLSRTTLFSVAAMLGLALLAIPSSFSSSGLASAQPSGEALLAKKVARLSAKASANKGIINLDSSAFEDVMSKPRNYSVVVLFTAISPEFNCVPCLNFDPEYKLVASGWSKLAEKSQLYFSVLDFKAGQEIFQKMGMNSAPSVLYFPATASQSTQDRYDFGRLGFQAEPFANWLNARAGTSIKVQRPINYMDLSIKIIGVISCLFTGYQLITKAGKILGSKYVWSAVSMFTIFIMISGHMWNQIRNPPYTAPGRDGRPGFIAQGFQNQFGLESQIVAVLYALICGSAIVLISVVPKIENPTQQRLVVWVAMGFFGFFFSVLIKLFQVKNPGYPFTLLFK
ncbi:oligosaccharyl transferase subunit ost3/OST6 [Podila horticola]|nr:oligosaccharyl transferase subunit ost3/OST6 [Podila horticola]